MKAIDFLRKRSFKLPLIFGPLHNLAQAMEDYANSENSQIKALAESYKFNCKVSEGLVKSYESQNAALNAEVQRQYNEIAALKSKLNTDIPTLDRNTTTATLKAVKDKIDVLENKKVLKRTEEKGKKTAAEWDELLKRAQALLPNVLDLDKTDIAYFDWPGAPMLSWANMITLQRIYKILEKHGFKFDNKDGGMYQPFTGCSFSFEYLSKYNSVEAFQKDWPYK